MPESQKGSDPTLEEWFAAKKAWVKAHPWKALLYAIPFALILPAILLSLLSRRGGSGALVRANELLEEREELNRRDAEIAEKTNSDVADLRLEGDRMVNAAERRAEVKNSRDEAAVVAERDRLAKNTDALLQALRDDAEKDRT